MVAPDWSLLSEVDGFEIGGVEKGRSGGGSNRAHRRLARPRKTDEQGLRRSSPQSGQSQTGRILAHDQPRIICRVGTVCARNSMPTAFQGTCWSNGLYLVQPEEFEPPTYRAESSSTSRLSGMSRARHCATSSIGPGGGRAWSMSGQPTGCSRKLWCVWNMSTAICQSVTLSSRRRNSQSSLILTQVEETSTGETDNGVPSM